ncbi:MAG: flagellar biosynthetic protein FliO [Pseudobdellovibrio sp.]
MMKTLLSVLTLVVFQTSFAAVETTTITAPVVAAATAATPVESTKVETAKLAEDQIPLAIETTKKAADTNSSTAKALMSMVIVAILLATSYYFVRKYKFSNKINKSNMQIKVLSQHYLGPKKSLAIVHVAGESILIGVTDQNISMIKSLSLIDDEVPANLPNTFGQTLAVAEAAPVAAPAATTGTAAGKTKQYELEEEFSFSNVTDTVSKKIKSMRSFS